MHLKYQPSLITESQVQGIAHTLSRGLSALVSDAGSKIISELDLFSDHDKKRVSEWNRPEVPVVEDCVHHIVGRQVSTDKLMLFSAHFLTPKQRSL